MLNYRSYCHTVFPHVHVVVRLINEDLMIPRARIVCSLPLRQEIVNDLVSLCIPDPTSREAHFGLGRPRPIPRADIHQKLRAMVRMPRTRQHGVHHAPGLVLEQGRKLLLPQDGAVRDMVPQAGPVKGALAHVLEAQGAGHGLVGVAAPAGGGRVVVLVRVLVDEFLRVARGRDPVVEEDVILAAVGAGLRDGGAAGEVSVGGDVEARVAAIRCGWGCGGVEGGVVRGNLGAGGDGNGGGETTTTTVGVGGGGGRGCCTGVVVTRIVAGVEEVEETCPEKGGCKDEH